MIPTLLASVTLLAAAQAANLPDAVHDRGGVSFDLAAIASERYPDVFPQVGPNLLPDPWRGIYSNDQNRVISLPHARGGKFRIAAWTKVHPLDRDTPMKDTAIMIRIGNHRSGKRGFVETPKRGGYVWNGFMKKGADWHVATKVFDVRPGEDAALVMLKCSSAWLEVKDVVLCEEVPQPGGAKTAEAEKPFTITTQFCSYLDGTFEVSQGQVGELAFSFRRPAAEQRYDVRKGVFTLELPAGIEFVDSTFARKGSARTERRADGSSVTTFSPRFDFRVGVSDAWWTSRHILVKAEGAVGTTGVGSLAYRYAAGDRVREAESMKIRFVVAPTIRGAQPKAYGCGGWQLDAYAFEEPKSAEALARFHQTCGQTWIIPSAATTYPYLALWRDCGFARVTPQSGTWCRNGYELSFGDVPESDRFVAVGPVEHRWTYAFKAAVCPSAVTAGTEYVRSVVFRRIADNVKGGIDGLWSNWEPFMYRRKGCGCMRCGRAFAAFVGESWSTLSNEWPTCAFAEGRLAQKGEEFRSRLHGDVVRAIDAVVRAETGKDSIGFMPGIHFGQMTSSRRTHHPMPEASPEHYAADIPYINLWGPYVAWRASHPYNLERARHVVHFVAARDLREQIAADYPAGKRPRILAGPQGTCGDYFNQPEAFEMDFDAYFFNGFAGCCPWVFPMGADARYWRAFANASVRAARYEDVVAGGKAADAAVEIVTVPEFAAPVERISNYLSKWRRVPQIHSVSYAAEDARIVAVFNCWQAGEAFFTLKVRDLPKGRYMLVSDDGTLWAKDRGTDGFEAEELASGVFLSVGCCRTRVFEVVPVGGKPWTAPRTVMTAERLKEVYAARRPALRAAAETDARVAEDDLAGISRID